METSLRERLGLFWIRRIEPALDRSRPVLHWLLGALGVAVLALLALILWDVWRGLHSNHVNQIGYTFDNVNRVVREALGTSAQVRDVAKKVNADSETELANSAAAVAETRAAVASFQSLVAHTDKSLNAPGGVLPALAGTAGETTKQIGLIGAETAETIKRIGPVIEQTGATVQQAGAAIAHLEPILDFTAQSAQNLAKLSADEDLLTAIHEAAEIGAHVDAITGSAQLTAADIQKWVHMNTAPKRWFISLGEHVAGLGIGAYGVLK